MKILENCKNLVKLYIKLFKQSWRLKMREWISVKDKLPEEWDRVLICDVNDETEDYESGVTEATFTPCGKGCCEPRFESKGLEYIDHINVTHWMYMPKPPKDE